MTVKRVIVQEGSFPSQCTGCRICELICSFTHYHIFNPSLSRIKVTKIEPLLIDHPVTCRQCQRPPCHEVCPTHAITRNNDLGVNHIHEKLCIGCGECALACPFGAIYIPSGENFPISCDLCGGDPQCVRFCPFKVLQCRGDEDVAKEKRHKVAEGKGHRPKRTNGDIGDTQ